MLSTPESRLSAYNRRTRGHFSHGRPEPRRPVGQDLLAKYNEIGSVKGTIGSGSSQKLNLGRAEGAPFSSFAMTVKQLPKAAEIFRDLMIEEHRWPSSIKAEDLVPTHDAICMGADKLFTGNLGCK